MEEINAIYTKEYCHQLELAYGDHMMSDGRAEAIEEMFENIDLNHKTALDFGAGLGGVAFYLAAKHHTQVVGVEVNPEMIELALKKRPEALETLVDFQLIKEDQILPCPDASFDIIYSKGVIVHLPGNERETTLKEFHRILKKGGTLVIQDWLSPLDGEWCQEVKDLIETESLPLYAHSPQSYIQELTEHGFKDIDYSDHSQQYAVYNQGVVDRLSSQRVKDTFINAYGEKLYNEHIDGYKDIRDTNKTGKVITARFVAIK